VARAVLLEGAAAPLLEIRLNLTRHIRRLISRKPLPLCIGVAAAPGMLHAQVGLTSGLAQVELVARVAPRGSIERVGPELETGRQGTIREVSVRVGVAANTGFRLVVRRTDAEAMVSGRAPQLWVRAVNGEYQLLGDDRPIVVSREEPAAGQTEREVRYRREESDSLHSLPVRYEIVIDPEL
jgi:hypothetical protein